MIHTAAVCGSPAGSSVATTQVDDQAQMYAMAGSEANSCKNRLLKNYKSNEETLQHTYVMVLMRNGIAAISI
jgi:hypothetical protein